MKIGRNDLCPCASASRRPWLCLRTLVNFAVFPGLAEVEPTTKDRYDGHYRVRKRLLLADAVRFHIPG